MEEAEKEKLYIDSSTGWIIVSKQQNLSDEY